MTVPDEKTFEDLIALLDSSAIAIEKFCHESLEALAKPASVGQITRFVNQAYENGNSVWDAIAQHEVMRWLFSDPAFKRASIMLFRRIEPRSRDETIKSQVAWYEKNSASKQGLHVLGMRVAQRLKPSEFWPAQVAQAVHRYLHVDIDSLYAGRKVGMKKLQQMETLFAEVKSAMGADMSEWDVAQLERALGRWLRKAADLQQRDQKNKREREFVMSMAMENIRYGNHTPKPQVIAELMSMGCFDAQLDLRTIARICAELTKKRQKQREIAMARYAQQEAEKAMANADLKT